jgi:hypothetical protein
MLGKNVEESFLALASLANPSYDPNGLIEKLCGS